MSPVGPALPGKLTASLVLGLVCLLTAPGLSAQESWEAMAKSVPRWAPKSKLVSGTNQLTIEGEHLVRRRGGGEIALSSTSADGLGVPYDLARDPAGISVIAAAQGVFVLSREVDALDPLEVMEPLLLGPVRALHCDARRRLWFAGHGVFGVLEMGGLWGYRFTDEDLPEPLRRAETLRVAPAPRGGLWVHGQFAGGGEPLVYRYRPDQGEEPRVTSVSIDGSAWDPTLAVQVTYPDGFRLAASGSALGGARFRFRVDEHHVWRDLAPDAFVGRFSPGEHTLDVIAVDRDLNRSQPLRLKVHSAFPARFDKRFVIAALGTFGLLALVGFLLYERRSGWRSGYLMRVPLSAGLLTVLCLQVLAGIEPHGKGWPFMGFSMYTTRFDEGDVIFEVVLVGLQVDGTQRVIPPQAVGVAIDGRWQVLGPLVDRGDEVARQYLETYIHKHPESGVIGLQVRARRHRLTADGAIPVAPQILSHYRAPYGSPLDTEGEPDRDG